MGLKIHKYSTIAMIAIGSGQFGQLHTTFSHKHKIRVIYMRLKRKYRVHAFFALIYSEQSCGKILSGGCEQILIIISASEARTFSARVKCTKVYFCRVCVLVFASLCLNVFSLFLSL